ncbi:NAD(P)(+) transhydrogenase (Re/Si-specific) subunit beta [Algoriphagus zhangzhouensis]|uniref:NAD(P) transhydrogenase subunit beta n=1 Tax=Algoriphagus zhangzhouensis TaxID=1073327 RepID=A0A1M7ZJC2_9BACT|nr:NAD(P)(+) transhydrogenase (Re/Si-specific) subunit beta [Algoriphagus zhangzhouensis]TDY43560.1 NAD(P) transhydrogenase subunit beta [Algoriphagus zhangzhouensis]SHO65010.1 NAD(P) transhydrogenase subunit beta [Algoriphagus zhangzhouensis]
MTELLGLSILELCYIVASITFILGLKMLSSPDKARRGNLIAGYGMGLAIFATIFFKEELTPDKWLNYTLILSGLIVGTVIGTRMALKVKMTAMPQMVSFFNGMGGACAGVISLVEFDHLRHNPNPETGMLIVILLGLIIGSVSFSGSMIAYGKLEGKIKDKALPGGQIINILLLLALFGLAIWMSFTGNLSPTLLYVLLAISLLYGVLFVMPIGGADMPVVISLLNSFTGMAAAFGGFLYGNQAMLTGGILVGSAGTILTVLMCTAMNRSLTNVIIGSFGGGSSSSAKSGEQGTAKEISVTDAAILLAYANKVSVVPGYGLAVAQAQHTIHNLEKILEEKGVDMNYAIHPVAGRMPGHMNVLLAEADVPYPKLLEMEDANEDMGSTDVVLVIGANDVVNPAAETDAGSPIYGMPVIKVWNAKNIIVLKRSMGKGYAGIENELFFHDKNRMLFGDAKDSLEKLIAEVKNL